MTEEEKKDLVALVRVLIGDVEGSVFFPILSDEEIESLLEIEDWNPMKAARRAAMSIAFMLSTNNYKERTDEIEVVNMAASEYRKVLSMFLDSSGSVNLPSDIRPYAAGISKSDYCKSTNSCDIRRSPLVQITPCLNWWTNVKGWGCC